MNPPPKMAPHSRFAWCASAMMRRILGAGAVILSFSLVWASANRLTRVREQVGSLTAQATRLTAEIDVMRAQWPPARTQHIQANLPAAQAKLFQGPPALADWMRLAEAQAVPLALETQFELLGMRTQHIHQPIAIMQTRLDLQPSRDAVSPRPSYQRLLEFARFLSLTNQRLDIVELSVTGTSNSVGSASLVLELWADHQPALPP